MLFVGLLAGLNKLKPLRLEEEGMKQSAVYRLLFAI